MSDIDVAAADHLLKTTKQVRQRLDLTRPVPRELLLECIDVSRGESPSASLRRKSYGTNTVGGRPSAMVCPCAAAISGVGSSMSPGSTSSTGITVSQGSPEKRE